MRNKATPPATSERRFEAEIYRDLDRRLRGSQWRGGASEAHGLLSALACRGVPDGGIVGKAWLFQLSEQADLDLLEGMYGLILRDLQSDGFGFNLLLADDGFSDAQRIESLADWCAGFIQGFLHDADGKTLLDGIPKRARESVNDIMEISRVDSDSDPASEENERQLVEIEEYLRVAVQVIFEELTPNRRQPAAAGTAVAGTTGIN